MGMPRAYGFAFNANYMYGENVMWFLRFHVTPNFAITPDLQVIVNLSVKPNVNTGVRARMSF